MGLKLPSETSFYSIRCGLRQSAPASLFLGQAASELDQNGAIRPHGEVRKITMNKKRTRRSIVWIGIALLFGATSQAQQKKAPKTCWDAAMTQLAMNDCAGKELRSSEQRNVVLAHKAWFAPGRSGTKSMGGVS